MRAMRIQVICSPSNKQAVCILKTAGAAVRPHPTLAFNSSQLSAASARKVLAYSTSSSTIVEGTMTGSVHAQKAWQHWKQLGSPKFIVAPMVDQSELPFRMLCRKYGCTAAYTPMLHARLFSEGPKYREEHLSTCPEDRPLFVQFCANDPDVLVDAAQHVEEVADYIDLNFGCPQRIAKKGRYGAFLMDDLPCVASLVSALHERTSTPVSAKIRIFPELSRTLEYAKLIEASGASLVAVHGRTRDQKDAASVRADWDAIKAVKDALSIPVLGNGDIQSREDAVRMMEYTGVDGVLSASPLLEDPRLFWEERSAKEPYAPLKCFEMAHEYLALCDQYPVPMRMVRGHVHKIVGAWFQEFTDIRDGFTRPTVDFTVAFCKDTVTKLEAAARATGREHPVPKMSARKQARLAREEAISGAKMEQARQDRALEALAKKRAAAALEGGSSAGEPQKAAGNVGDATTTQLHMNPNPGSKEAQQITAAARCEEGAAATSNGLEEGPSNSLQDMPGGVRKQARVLNSVTV